MKRERIRGNTMRIAAVLLTLAMVMATVPFALAASGETYYTVTGTVVNAEDGTPVENATVTFDDGTYEFTATTGADGTYSLQALYGIYNVTVEADGYETYTKRNVTVLIGGENKLDASLTRDPNAPNPDPSTPFTDVAEGAYYDEAVAYV